MEDKNNMRERYATGNYLLYVYSYSQTWELLHDPQFMDEPQFMDDAKYYKLIHKRHADIAEAIVNGERVVMKLEYQDNKGCGAPLGLDFFDFYNEKDDYIKVNDAVNYQDKDKVTFKKFDSNKNRLELIEPKFIEGIGHILTFGAEKYPVDNWKLMTEDDLRRVKGALLRHTYAYLGSELNDPETGKSHLYHATCCMMFLDYFDRNNKTVKEE